MITKSQALAKLAGNPQVASAFDAATARDHPGMSRDQAVDLTLKALNLKRDKSENLAKLKKQSLALKAKLAELKEILGKAEAKAANKLTAVTITACGITSHSQRGGRAMKQSKI